MTVIVEANVKNEDDLSFDDEFANEYLPQLKVYDGAYNGNNVFY